jgi:ATP adenylyltransferase
MERLWTPWRLAYITGAVGGGAGSDDSCIFCDAGPGSQRADLVLVRTPLSYVVLNLFPYNNGHLMVVPNRHVAALASCTADELTDLMRLTRDAEIALAEAYTPQGMNVGLNLGAPAGAGVVGHLHIHVVPRWTGDTSFMSVVGDTRVLPEELPQTVKRLRPIFERLSQQHS